MLVKCSVNSIEIENISYSVTLVPRLEYSMNILDDVIDVLNSKQIQLKESNPDLIHDFDESDKLHNDALRLEHLVTLSLEILLSVKKNMEKIPNISSIPDILPSTISMIRTVSAHFLNLFQIAVKNYLNYLFTWVV